MKHSGLSVLIPTAGMELCRLFAFASLIFLIPDAAPFSFASAGLVLVCGMFLGRGLRRVQRRIVTDVLLYGAGCFISVFFMLKKVPWGISGVAEWATVFFAALFWFRGARIGAREVSHSLTVNRYDIGLGILLAVYFLRFGIREPDALAPRLAGAYFLFAIIALFASRSSGRDAAFTGVRSAAGFLLPFLTLFFLAAALLILLYPLLTQAAAEAYTVLREGAAPLGRFFVAVIRFLFGFRRGADGAEATAAETGEAFSGMAGESSGSGVFEKIILAVLTLTGAAALLVLVCMLGRCLFVWLSLRKGPESGGAGLLASLRNFFAALLRAFCSVGERLKSAVMHSRRENPFAPGAEAFRRLCLWGRLSGVPRQKTETPSEYCARLSRRFPPAEEAAAALVAEAEREIYGNKSLSAESRSRIENALTRLGNPRLLPARLISRLRRREE